MDPRIRDMWADALESGEYSKGQGYLKLSGEYCCLGVLTDLYVKETGDENVWKYNNDTLTNTVMEWAGLAVRNPKVMVPADSWHLASSRRSHYVSDKPLPLSTLNDILFPSNGFPLIARAIRGDEKAPLVNILAGEGM